MPMRFRRRHDAVPEPESDDRVWARPEDAGGDSAVETGDDAGEWTDDDLPETPADDLAEVEAWEAPVEVEQWEAPAEPVEAPRAPEPRERAPQAPTEGTVRAAGGVIWTRWRGALQVLLVHRPRYDDWSLPKGKAGPGESDSECALREVREETGLACSLGEEIGVTAYHDRHGRPKTVRYYLMQPLGGAPSPQAEVDEVRWLGIEAAKELITYKREITLLDALVKRAARAELDRDEPPEAAGP